MPAKYGSVKQRENLSREVNAMDRAQKDPVSWSKIKDKPAFIERLDRTRKQLEILTPPTVDAPLKDKLRKRLSTLEEALVNGREGLVPPMPTVEQEQKVPAGTVGQGIIHDKFWKRHTLDEEGNIAPVPQGGRGAKFEWKDLRRIVYKDIEVDDPDVANLERIRPTGRTSPLADQVLPLTYGFSRAAKEKYDEAFPDHEPTVVEQKLSETAPKRRQPPKTRKPRKPLAPGVPQCEAIQRDGTRCQCAARPNKKYCFSKFHEKQILERDAKLQQEAEVTSTEVKTPVNN